MQYKDWRAELATVPRLRMSQVVGFLRQSGRAETCPFCSYKGVWDFHVEMPEDEAEVDADSLMALYKMATGRGGEEYECVAISCPSCAHFSMLDVNRIKRYIFLRAQAQEQHDG